MESQLAKTVIINPDNSIKETKPTNEKIFSLTELQEIVGGYIEIVFFQNGYCLVVNEEGKLNGLPLNPYATLLMYENGINDVIVGNALHCHITQLD